LQIGSRNEFRIFYLCEFKLGYNAAEATRNINNALEEGSVTESTMHIGLSNFVVEPLALKMKRIVDENEKKSICQSSMQTKEGNLKVPNYNTVSE